MTTTNIMKFSIVTVCRNSVLTIERALASVAAQTGVSIEHIVIDGASTDGTMAILQRHRDALTHIVSEPDNGIYDAMNKGIALASGDVIGFLNADDFFSSPDIISKIERCFVRQDLDGVLGDVTFFRANAPDTVIRRYNSGKFTPSKISWGWMPAHPGMYLRRSIYDQIGPFRTDYKIAGDFEFVARAFGTSSLRTIHLPEPIVRMQAGGVSTRDWRSSIILNREIIRACRENGISTNVIKLMAKFPSKMLELVRR
jgi:glycosyltransferase involved in cell wall biosynthesis